MKQSLPAKKYLSAFLYSQWVVQDYYSTDLSKKIVDALPDDLMVVVDDPSFDTPKIGMEEEA